MVRVLWKTALVLAVVSVVGLWLNWQFSAPSHDRSWQPLYARLPMVEKVGDGYRLTDIRNWSYQETGTGSPAWVETVIDPKSLKSVYFVVEPFGENPAVAHTMLSFEFVDGSAYVASVEARREEGEVYGGLKAGVWPMHEYMFVWTTERDMYANTTFVAGDDLYVYELDLSPQAAEAVLVAMLEETADVAAKPRWYNTFFSNCTNVLARAVNAQTPDAVPWNIAWYLPGYAAEFLYDQGFIKGAGPFAELQAKAYLTPRVAAAYANVDPIAFSKALRE
ncbi:MAG: DUF4105 domain-containing protein [Paracoccaceae bacterium]|nr:DUF4105 domain-containing protein [Paracoccaceae bacterium]